MSQGNVERTLLINDAWNRRDVEATIALADPEFVWHPVLEETIETRAYRGHAGVRRYYEDLSEFSEESHAEYPVIHDLGDQVLGLGRAHFTFTGGIELEQEVAFLLTWSNGKCVEAQTWLSHAEALEAAGLEE
jgi:ketosteroid isomerase-like protein